MNVMGTNYESLPDVLTMSSSRGDSKGSRNEEPYGKRNGQCQSKEQHRVWQGVFEKDKNILSVPTDSLTIGSRGNTMFRGLRLFRQRTTNDRVIRFQGRRSSKWALVSTGTVANERNGSPETI